MKTVLVFGGTYEGRELVEAFDRSNIKCHVCVATEYGNQLLKESDNITIHTGRLDEVAMRELIEQINCDIVVDATHPYAVMVTSQIKRCLEGSDVAYIRLLRENDAHFEGEACFYADTKQCAEELSKCEGKILLTTGSKQLTDFTSIKNLKDRLIARVIPGVESLKLCHDAGLEGNQIIAMQGPFSQEMNEAIIKEYGIKHLVTKESGQSGGVDSKYAAAMRLGTKLHIIKRPDECETEKTEGLSLSATINKLEEMLGVVLDKGKVSVTLVGIGPGSPAMITKEAEAAIAEADIVMGAKRMIESVSCKAKKYPCYLKEDVIPLIKEMAEKRYDDIKAVVLFSGDTGFFSGSSKMYSALKSEKEFDVRVLPGISSISALSARLGIAWQDGSTVSLHGTDSEQWIPQVMDKISGTCKLFFITSGVEDIRIIGRLLEKEADTYKIYLGYRISYPDEEITEMNPQDCTKLDKEGLYTGVIISNKSC